MCDVEYLVDRKILFAEWLPIGDWVRSFHFHKYQLVRYYPVSFYRCQMRMLETFKSLYHLQCTTSFFLVQRRNIYAGNHLVFTSFLVTHNENFTITLTKVKRYYHVRVILWIGRAPIPLSCLLGVKHGIVVRILSRYFLTFHRWLKFEVLNGRSILIKVVWLVVELLLEAHVVLERIVVHHILLWGLLLVPFIILLLLNWREWCERGRDFLMWPDRRCTFTFLLLLPHVAYFTLILERSSVNIYTYLVKLHYLLCYCCSYYWN